jgi:proline dehydrogenase
MKRVLLTSSRIPRNTVRVSLSSKKTENFTPTNIDFSDTRVSFKSKTFTELIRGKLVFSTCQIRPLVKNSEALVKYSYKILRKNITNSLFRYTFFGHFCAGEDVVSIRPTVKKLEKSGVGSILDYAAEADITDDKPVHVATTVGKVSGRVYDYTDEDVCDKHYETFVTAIKNVKDVTPTGFAAIKCTALGNPELLKQASSALREIRELFYRLDANRTGYVTKEQFLQTFQTKIDGKDVLSYFDILDTDHDGKIDYIEWSNGLKLEHLHLLTQHCTEQGPLFRATLNEQERVLLKNMKDRVTKLAKLARELGVRVMIDAEHTYFQPAIDNITNELAKTYNKPDTFPVIFSTYQMYLKDSRSRLLTDLDRARKGNYKFAAKLVRGAYMVLERQYAKDNNLPDPIHENMQATHDNYNFALQETIKRIAAGHEIEIMIASHNQQSVELAVKTMNEHKLSPSVGVYFGQLLGMSDHLTFNLGDKGFKAYKYVPYGKVHEVMPYLIRRAQENSDALSGAAKELKMTNKEILRRLSLSKQET